MTRGAILFAGLLVACGQRQAPAPDAVAFDVARLSLRKAECRAGRLDEAVCRQVADEDVRRFLSGRSGPTEYQTLADLPAIPSSFDGPTESIDIPLLPTGEDAP